MNKENLVTIGTKIPLAYKHYLETIAVEQGISISELIRNCLPVYRKPEIPPVGPSYFGIRQPFSSSKKAQEGLFKTQKPNYFTSSSSDNTSIVLLAVTVITIGIILLPKQ